MESTPSSEKALKVAALKFYAAGLALGAIFSGAIMLGQKAPPGVAAAAFAICVTLPIAGMSPLIGSVIAHQAKRPWLRPLVISSSILIPALGFIFAGWWGVGVVTLAFPIVLLSIKFRE